MSDWQERTNLLIGEGLEKLSASKVLIIGLGGVGAVAAEMLCRAGIGNMTIIDGDTIHETNLNRQIFTRHGLIGKSKAEVLKEKFMDINPDLSVTAIDRFIKDDEMIDILKFDDFDYIVDAIDTISPKVFLLFHSYKMGLKTISSMGAGGRIDPSKVQVADISKSYNCPLARLVRKRLHRMGVYNGIKVVFSSEKIIDSSLIFVNETNKKTTLGTISYMPSLFGIYLASEVIRDLLKNV